MAMEVYITTSFILVLSVFLLTSAQFSQNVGDSCTYGRAVGICEVASKCQPPFGGFPNGRPPTCGYTRTEPIICCLTSSSATSNRRVPVSQNTLQNRTPSPNNNERISQRKCSEYSSSVWEISEAVGLSLIPVSVESRTAKCQYETVPLIVGGTIASQGEFPHMALVGWTSNGVVRWDCGGSLISNDYVLTAAHCNKSILPDVVRLGEQAISKSNDGANPIDVAIEMMISHPEYRYPKKYSDIALLKLRNRVQFGNDIRPACLWSRSQIGRTQAIATGWGITEAGNPDARSDELLKVGLNMIDNVRCAQQFQEYISARKLPLGIISTQICAGATQKDSCDGDSGGPLQIVDSENQCIYHLIGVTSFGASCGKASAPGVYTKVSDYIDWIEGIVWPNA